MPGVRSAARRRRRWLFRRIRNSVVGTLGPILVRLWVKTLRVRYVAEEQRRQGRIPEIPQGIFVFWHQRMLTFAGVFHHSGFQAIVSQHGDGEMLARILNGLGIRPIRGSTTRGGTQAIREVLRCRETGRVAIAITPDGPRGPRFQFREGAIYLASKTELPVYPVVVSFKRRYQLPTWDGFLFPIPFTRAVFRLGERIDVPADVTREQIETYRKEAEAKLRALTEATDRDFEDIYDKGKALRDLVEAPPHAIR